MPEPGTQLVVHSCIEPEGLDDCGLPSFVGCMQMRRVPQPKLAEKECCVGKHSPIHDIADARRMLAFGAAANKPPVLRTAVSVAHMYWNSGAHSFLCDKKLSRVLIPLSGFAETLPSCALFLCKAG